MAKQFMILTATFFMAFIVAFCLLYVLLKPSADDSLVQVSAQSAYNASSVKTTFTPLTTSMSDLLGGYRPYRIVSKNTTAKGLVVILEKIRGGLDVDTKSNILCMLTLPNSKKD